MGIVLFVIDIDISCAQKSVVLSTEIQIMDLIVLECTNC